MAAIGSGCSGAAEGGGSLSRRSVSEEKVDETARAALSEARGVSDTDRDVWRDLWRRANRASLSRPLEFAFIHGIDTIWITLTASTNEADREICAILESAAEPYLSDGGDCMKKGSQGLTLLHCAIAAGKTEWCERLIAKSRLVVQAKDDLGFTPLHYAARAGTLSVCRLLITNGASPNEATHFGNFTPLHGAALGGHCDTINLLLDNGADAAARVHDKRSSLDLACEMDNIDTIQLLLGRTGGVFRRVLNINTLAGHELRTPLFIAAEHGQEEAVRSLLDAGADWSKKDDKGRTPAMIACEEGHAGIARILLEKERASSFSIITLQSRHTDKDKKTLLHYASTREDLPFIQYLVEIGFSLRAQDSLCRTPLYFAVEKRLQATVSWILEHGGAVDVNLRMHYDRSCETTLLHIACSNGDLPIVNALLAHGANIYTKIRGTTPIMLTCQTGNGALAASLLDRYPDSESNFASMLTSACSSPKGTDIVRVLFARIPEPPDLSELLLTACMGGCLDTVKLLIEVGAPTLATFQFIHAVDVTLLHIASYFGHAEIVRVLLDHIEIDTEDQRGLTALHYACLQLKPEVARVLVEAGASTTKEAGAERHTPRDLIEKGIGGYVRCIDQNYKKNRQEISEIFNQLDSLRGGEEE